MTRSELISLIQREIKSLASKFDVDDYDSAIDDAQRDTGWQLPQTDDFRIKWLKSRTKRHLFFYLQTESASKFRFKNIHLNQRFENYSKLIGEMDDAFEKAQEENIYEFAGVSASSSIATRIDAGFQYEPQTGRDTTYDDSNQVILTPDENS